MGSAETSNATTVVQYRPHGCADPRRFIKSADRVASVTATDAKNANSPSHLHGEVSADASTSRDSASTAVTDRVLDLSDAKAIAIHSKSFSAESRCRAMPPT